MKSRHNGSAASAVAASAGSGGSSSNFVAHVMPNTFVVARIELKGWGSGGTSEERRSRWMRRKGLVSQIEATIPIADLN